MQHWSYLGFSNNFVNKLPNKKYGFKCSISYFRLKQFQLRNMEQLCSCLRVILGQAKSISEGRKTLIYTVQETSSTSPSPSAVHTVRMAEITEINPITRLIALAESDVLGSNVKAFFMCDLCMFTIDLTSILVTPGAAQKNEMLLSIGKKMFTPYFLE